ncbi:sensor histidine kinase [Pseudolysinimonas sp.]|uniref:sensor histidine kinase n=1 Tax=Pseudolysinimonas sp. TaxID=2680009 RepID=UPI003F7DE9DE
MAGAHASFDRWWNGISLRAKITGVTVLLLTFGLAVAGAGTTTVLRSYLLDQQDQKIQQLASQIVSGKLVCDLRYATSGVLEAIVTSSGDGFCTNLPNDGARPTLTSLNLHRVADLNGVPTTVPGSHGSSWRVVAVPVSTKDGVFYSVVIGVNMSETDGTIARFILIFFGFAVAVVVFGAATTQLLVSSTFAPLRDVEKTAARFAAGDYSQRLGGATPNTEVGRLNRSLNAMLARIDRAFADRERTVEQMRRFVGDASHELRTPLVSLRGYAELYRMGALQKPEDVAQAMDRIEREAIRMSALVQDLLELARLDEARPLVLAPVDLLRIAQDAALDASAGAPERRITVVASDTEAPATAPDEPVAAAETATAGRLRNATSATVTGSIRLADAVTRRLRRRARDAGEAVDAAPAPPPLPEIGPVVLAEEDKVRQVVTNLIGNAMRFTAADSPVELEVGVDRAAGFGQIAIVDHGEGIPPQLREKIFQRFWRADTSRTRDTGGSGLGLAIVAGIVQNHGGLVEVLETPGGGATFRVSLPLFRPEPNPAAADAAAPTPA